MAYRVLSSLFALAVCAGAILRRDWTGLTQRLGGGAVAASGHHLWLHAASNGELASVKPVIDRLRTARPDLDWLVTCNSRTGVALAQSWGLTARLAPLDLAWVVRRFVRNWRISGHIAAEAELWPHRIRLCPGPVIVLGARMSAGTSRNWARFPVLAGQTMGRLALVSPQDAGSRDRLAGLGVRPEAMAEVVELKALYAATGPDPDAALSAAFPRHGTWAAVSTHPGEEEIVLEAHRIARTDDPDLRLILVPRHPARADDIAALIAARGWPVARRSAGDAPDGPVYLADTMGETALWYQLAGRVFIGGSLVSKGGHTPFEPAAFGCALLHGPDMRNFAAPAERLAAAGASRVVADAAGLAAALTALSDETAQHHQGLAAQEALRGATDPDLLIDRILGLLSHAPTARQA
nr:glycosyltransferase N-terminal domain-containing protein [Thalassococcus arenae]